MSGQTSSNFEIGRGRKILESLFTPSRNENNHTAAFDTYQGLRHIKEMLKGGQITEDEYEAIKIELLNR
jgi:hypothetical protein